MVEINNQTRSRIDLKTVKAVAEKFLEKNKISNRAVSIGFVGDQVMRKLNQKYRGIDKPTDVLAFEERGKKSENLGEIIIDYAQIKRQASRFGHTPQAELVFILVHGLLHLIGYCDDKEKDRQNMIKIGEEFIKKYDKNRKIAKKL